MNLQQLAFSVLWIISTHALAAPQALLVGVGNYQDESLTDLEGPAHDVEALQRVLTEQWGFKTDDIVTLLDEQATREGILQEIAALADRTPDNDPIFIYFSGHGTSGLDPSSSQRAALMPHSSGALVPADFPAGGSSEQQYENLIVGARDLRPLLKTLEDDHPVLVVSDSCFSGNTVRSLMRDYSDRPSLPGRFIGPKTALGSRGGMDDEDIGAYAGRMESAERYPYENVLYLAAARESEVAADIGRRNLSAYPTVDEKPHGAFTDALLRVLSGAQTSDLDGDGRLSHKEINTAIQCYMDSQGFSQSPQMLPSSADDAHELAAQAAFFRNSDPQEIAIKGSASPLTVRLNPQVSEVAEALNGIPGVRVVAKDANLNIVTEAGTRKVVSSAGDLVTELPAEDQEALRDFIALQAWVHRVQAGGCGPAPFSVSVHFANPGQSEALLIGHEVDIVIRPQRAAQLLVVDVDPAGEAHILYPYDDTETRLTQDAISFTVEAAEPLGTENVVAFAFEKPQALIQDIVNRGVLTLYADSPELAELEQLMVHERNVAVGTLRMITVSRDAAKRDH